MEIRFVIDDKKVSTFIQSAKDELNNQTKLIAEAIADEAARIEKSERDGSEIVRSDVETASQLFKRHIERRKKKQSQTYCQAGSTITGLIAGGMISLYNEGVIFLILGILFLLASACLTLYLIFGKE